MPNVQAMLETGGHVAICAACGYNYHFELHEYKHPCGPCFCCGAPWMVFRVIKVTPDRRNALGTVVCDEFYAGGYIATGALDKKKSAEVRRALGFGEEEGLESARHTAPNVR